MATFTKCLEYKNFYIYKSMDSSIKYFFGAKVLSNKNEYEYRTKTYKTINNVKKEINQYLINKKMV